MITVRRLISDRRFVHTFDQVNDDCVSLPLIVGILERFFNLLVRFHFRPHVLVFDLDPIKSQLDVSTLQLLNFDFPCFSFVLFLNSAFLRHVAELRDTLQNDVDELHVE